MKDIERIASLIEKHRAAVVFVPDGEDAYGTKEELLPLMYEVLTEAISWVEDEVVDIYQCDGLGAKLEALESYCAQHLPEGDG